MKFKYLANTKFNLSDGRVTLREGETYDVVYTDKEYCIVKNEIGENQVVFYFMGEKEKTLSN